MEIYHYCRLPGLGVLYSFLMTSPIVFCPPFVISYVYTKQKTNSVGLLGFFSFFIQINRLAIILHRKLRVGWIASKPITGENPFRLVDLLTKLVDNLCTGIGTILLLSASSESIYLLPKWLLTCGNLSVDTGHGNLLFSQQYNRVRTKPYALTRRR